MRSPLRFTLVLFFLLVLSLRISEATQSISDRRFLLKALINQASTYSIRDDPWTASTLYANQNNSVLSYVNAASRRCLAELQTVDTTGFPEQEKLNQRLMIRILGQNISGERFKAWEMPINQVDGFHLDAADWPNLMPFHTTRDYYNYVALLCQLPFYFGQEIALMRQGERDGLMPPRYLLEKVPAQIDAILAGDGVDNLFAAPLLRFPSSIRTTDRKSLRKTLLAAINDSVAPAYRRLRSFISNEYAPKGRGEPGIWALPDGAARYAYIVKEYTTTDLTPEAIYQLGLQQVAEYEAEETALAAQLGYPDLRSLRITINSDPMLHVRSAAELLTLYRKFTDQMYTRLPELFTRIPKARVEIVPTEVFRSRDAAPAEYLPADPDGAQPARIVVNTYSWRDRLTTECEATAYHEGVPGHHLQEAILEGLKDLPSFRREATYNAFGEGWAFYAERLGKEVGFFEDTYSEFGRIENELWRSIRLVIDTGLHSKMWSRQKAVDYFQSHTTMPDVVVQSEIDRYVARPGQALAYKIGQLTILRLRDKAKTVLGDKFNLRLFHDQVLGSGPLPLDILEEHIDAWIAGCKAGQPGELGAPRGAY